MEKWRKAAVDFGLRPYQVDGVAQIAAAWDEGRRRVLYQLPTGGGKTSLGVFWCRESLRQPGKGRRVVWLTHRQELREQSLKELESKGLLVCDLSKTVMAKRRLAAGVASIVAPGLKGIDFGAVKPHDLLVVDEAHHAAASTWSENFLQKWPGRILGLTATPWRMSRKQGFEDLFEALVCGPGVADLASFGYLSPVRVVRVPAWSLMEGSGRDVAGDYAAGRTAEVNRPILFSDLPVRAWANSPAAGQRTIWYVPTLEAGAALCGNLNRAGFAAGFVHGAMPAAERRDLVAGFGDGRLGHLVNVAVIAEGFDCPEAGCVVIARPTRSLALYLQMVGRAMRPAPGKTVAYVLDLGQSWKENGLGHPAEPRQWSLAPRGSKDSVGEMVSKECPDCGELAPAALRECGSCGHSFGRLCPGCSRYRYESRWRLQASMCDECDLTDRANNMLVRPARYHCWDTIGEHKSALYLERVKFLVMPSRFSKGWICGLAELNGGKVRWRDGFDYEHEAQAYVESVICNLLAPQRVAAVAAGAESPGEVVREAALRVF